MKAQTNKLIPSYLFVAIMLAIPWSFAAGDDLNPPPYRGDPLSVHAHWSTGTSGQFGLMNFSWVDDNDPSTQLYPSEPFYLFDPASGGYDFQIPNFIDELPLKLLRLQLTWEGTTQPPVSIVALGQDLGQGVPGIVTYYSSPLVFTQPDGGYQYFDIEFRPNPDFEMLHIELAPDAQLAQVVIDSVSTIPEPATMGLLGIGAMTLLIRRKR